MATPFLIHWYVKGPVPLAVTVKLVDWPATTFRATGGVVTAAGRQVTIVAAALVSVPAEFVMTTS
jgi:hypothetical protein